MTRTAPLPDRDIHADSPVGIIGVGSIGAAAALRLEACGLDVVVFDPDPGRVEWAHNNSVEIRSSCEDLWRAAGKVVLIVVRTAEQVEAVLQCAPSDCSGRVAVVLSTIGPSSIESVASLCAERQLELVDAPLSGGVSSTESGELAIMVAASDRGFEMAAEVLGSLGRCIHVGNEPGAGQAVKVANQMVMAASVVASIEALGIAEQYGVRREVFQDVLAHSTGRCWAIDNLERVVDMWELGPSGPLELLRKDLNLVTSQTAAGRDDRTIAGELLDRLFKPTTTPTEERQ